MTVSAQVAQSRQGSEQRELGVRRDEPVAKRRRLAPEVEPQPLVLDRREGLPLEGEPDELIEEASSSLGRAHAIFGRGCERQSAQSQGDPTTA